MQFSRRHFLGFGALGATTLIFPGLFRSRAYARSRNEPHFFLQIFFNGGMDASAHFDARPLALTAAGKKLNYFGEEPELWVGRNGGRALVQNKAIAALLPYKDDISIINGIHMAQGFDGHDQNTNAFFAGNPFGGDSFVPQLNAFADNYPIDSLVNGFVFGQFSNMGGSVALTPSGTRSLVEKLKAQSELSDVDPSFLFVKERMEKNALGSDLFSIGAGKMRSGSERVSQLADQLKNLSIDDNGDVSTSGLKLVLQCFGAGMAGGAVLAPSTFALDAHDSQTAKAQPVTVAKALDFVATIIKTLKETPFDATRSYFDVTTLLVSSEFSRTMRQTYNSIDDTGCDHNPLTNTMILAGKKIRGGCVLGASDFQTADEHLSKAHVLQDAEGLKIMGRPFDFSTQMPRDDLPDVYNAADYLTCGSVVNTVLSAFGMPDSFMRVLSRNGPKAPLLSGLLRS